MKLLATRHVQAVVQALQRPVLRPLIRLASNLNSAWRKALRASRFAMFASLSAIAAYAAIAVGTNRLSTAWRITLGVVSAIIVGIITAIQVVLSLDVRKTNSEENALRRKPIQLPRDLQDFTGRSPEVTWLLQALTKRPIRSGAVAISAIAGQGGVGKTVLAVHVAHLVAEQFPHGQIYVNLRGPEEQALLPYDVLGGLLRELGISVDAIPVNLEERSRLFRSVLGRMRILVLLDNAQDEAQIRPLLPGESSSVVLITSRSRLAGLEGVEVLRLDVMSEGEALELLSQIIGEQKLAEESTAARELVTLCAFLPLAVRIIGARLLANPHWTLASLADNLHQRKQLLNQLEYGERAVRATLDISYVALSASAALTFCALGSLIIRSFPDWLFSVIRTGREDEAKVERDELIQTELLQFLGVDRLGTSRYGFHDLLREYARDKLDSLDNGTSQLRNETIRLTGQGYAKIVEVADNCVRRGAPRHDVQPHLPDSELSETQLIDIASYDAATEWCRVELLNLLLLLEQLHSIAMHDLVVQIAHSMSAFCEDKSYWREWESAQKIALTSARSLGDPYLECLSLSTLGRIHHLLGDWALAMTELKDAQDLAVMHDYKDIIAASMCAIGKIYQLGRLEEAVPQFTRARELYNEIGHRHAAAYVTANLADIYHGLTEYDRSLAEFSICMPVFREVGDKWWEANAGIWIGDVYRGQGDMVAAIEQLESSLRIMRGLGDERRAAVALVHMARTYADFGEARLALRSAGEALPILEKVSDRWWLAMAYVELGKAYAVMENPTVALSWWQKAIPTVEEMGNVRVLSDLERRIEELRT
jgi:tetratricopeptide (TPR) repeat protein